MWFFRGKKKDITTFEQEALCHLDAVYRFALHLTKDPAEADDLVQETYLKALKAFDSYTEGTNCKAWLLKIMRNAYINRVRETNKDLSIEEKKDLFRATSLAGWSERAFYRTPEATTLLTATRMEIEKALERLPEDFRNAVILSDIEGLSYKEIADVMGTPIGTVMSRLFRGRRMLKEFLIKRLGNDVTYENGAEIIDFKKPKEENSHDL